MRFFRFLYNISSNVRNVDSFGLQRFILPHKIDSLHFSTRNMVNETKKLKTSDSTKKIGTHSGTFHCDEVLACYMLQQLEEYKDSEIVRSRDINILNTCDIVVDVGEVFNRETNRFDHHQRSFRETLSSLRPELGDEFNIRLSSAGLVYTYFGEQVIANILKKEKNLEYSKETILILYKKVYEQFIREIDAIDNGVPICDGEPHYHITTHLSHRIGNFNPSWNDDENIDETTQFEAAKQQVGKEFAEKIINFATSWLPARVLVKQAIENSKVIHESLEIIELEKYCPWKFHLFDLEKELNIEGRIKYVLYVDRGNDWRVNAVPVKPNSFICRKFLHKEWRGLRTNDIIKVSGIKDSVFCHATGFIGGALSRDGVYQMAVKSLYGEFEN